MNIVLLFFMTVLSLIFPQIFLLLLFPFALHFSWNTEPFFSLVPFAMMGFSFDLLNPSLPFLMHALIFVLLAIALLPLKKRLRPSSITFAMLSFLFFFSFQGVQILIFQLPIIFSSYFFEYMLFYPLKSSMLAFLSALILQKNYENTRWKSPTAKMYRAA